MKIRVLNFTLATIFLTFFFSSACQAQEVGAVLSSLVYIWGGIFGLSLICAGIFTGVNPVSKDMLKLGVLLFFVNITTLFMAGMFGAYFLHAHLGLYFVSTLVICHFFRKKLVIVNQKKDENNRLHGLCPLLFSPFFLFLFFGPVSPINACGPYHEWETTKERLESAYLTRPMTDAAYGIWLNLSGLLKNQKLKVALVSLSIDAELKKKRSDFDWIRMFDNLESNLKTASKLSANKKYMKNRPSAGALSIIDSDDLYTIMGREKVDVDDLFNTAVMQKIGNLAQVDAFLYAVVTECNVLHRSAIDRQPNVKDVQGAFIVETLTIRAKLVNAKTGMVDWIDELRARYSETVIYKIHIDKPEQPEMFDIFKTVRGWCEVYEYISDNKFKPGSITIITHEGGKINSVVKSRVKDAFFLLDKKVDF